MAGDTCDVCRIRPTLGVASSGLGPMSLAYCQECANVYAEPEWMLNYTWDSTEGDVAEWVKEICTWKDDRYWTWDEWTAWRYYEWFTPDPMIHWWAFKPHGPLEDSTPEALASPQADFDDFDDVLNNQSISKT